MAKSLEVSSLVLCAMFAFVAFGSIDAGWPYTPAYIAASMLGALVYLGARMLQALEEIKQLLAKRSSPES